MFSQWKQAPFAQILFPFALGIVLHIYFPGLSWKWVLAFLVVLALIYVALSWYGKKLKS